jgi:hypothetical protein
MNNFEFFSKIKNNLIDAPKDIKMSFNTLINYFAGKYESNSYSSDSYQDEEDTELENYALLEDVFINYTKDSDYYSFYKNYKKIASDLNVAPNLVLAGISGAAEGANIHRLVERIDKEKGVYWNAYLGLQNHRFGLRSGKGPRREFSDLQSLRKQIRLSSRYKGKYEEDFSSKLKEFSKVISRYTSNEVTKEMREDYPKQYNSNSYSSYSYNSDSYKGKGKF